MVNSSQVNGNLEIAQSNQELMTNKNRHRKRLIKIFIGVVVVILIAIIVAAIVILTANSNSPPRSSPIVQNGPTISLEDVLEGRLQYRSFNATWVTGSTLLYKDVLGDIFLYDVRLKEKKLVLPANNAVLSGAFDYQLSADRKYLSVAHGFLKTYRHSYRCFYTIVNLENLGAKDLAVNGSKLFQLAIWGPVGNALVMVQENNIFYRPSIELDTQTAITSDGFIGHIYNGVPDWVYEEEVLSSNKALWISPNGKKLAFAKFNDTRTPVMTVPIYGHPGSLEFQYTRPLPIRYPKPGTPNPDVGLYVVDLESVSENPELEFNCGAPLELGKEPILSAVKWASDDQVAAIWMNRVQNKAAIVSYDFVVAKPPGSVIVSDVIVANYTEKHGWLELFTAPIFSKDGSRFVIILSQDQGSDAGAYRHIVMYTSLTKNAKPIALTKGKYVVNDITDWDDKNETVYFVATSEEDPATQHLYRAFSNVTAAQPATCMTCSIKSDTSPKGCLYNDVMFSKDFSLYTLNCEGPGVPHTSIFTNEVKPKKLIEWETNEELVELVADKMLPTLKRMTFDLEGGFKAHVSLKLPPGMDTSGAVKYPMLVNVYGGPGSFQVVEKFGLDWGSYLAANKSVIVATIDGRGSGLKGDKILFAGYRHLGTVEVFDQIFVTKKIQETLPYVDKTRTAIWGWSYGGYASGMALANDTEGVFKCGISVAPVTDWALYDSIYTERFMGLPTVNDNLEGYHKAQLLNKVDLLRDKKYFLVHGTLDDNVHYQQSMLLAKVLEQKDILFRQQSYTDEDHALANVRPHLYHSLERFLDDCFIEPSDI